MSVWQAKVAVAAKKDALAKASAERTAREDAEAISTFLTEVFQSPIPGQGGRTITVAETLDRSVKKLEENLAKQPERRAGRRAPAASGSCPNRTGHSDQDLPSVLNSLPAAREGPSLLMTHTTFSVLAPTTERIDRFLADQLAVSRTRSTPRWTG